MENQLDQSYNNLMAKLGGWLDAFVVNLPNIAIAVLIFGIAYFLSNKLPSLLSRVLFKGIKQESIKNLLTNMIALIVLSVGLFLALGVLNLDKALTSILAGAGVAGLAVGLALQGTLSNTFSGIFLAVKDIVNIGDFIETNGYSGKVDSITLRYIRLREGDNNVVIIPNRLIVENPFKNYGLTKRVRTKIRCGVGYEHDLQKVRQLAIATISDLFPQKDKEIEFHYLEFGDSSINFEIRFWVDATTNKKILEVRSEAIIALKECFDEENINIPYPIRTLYRMNDN